VLVAAACAILLAATPEAGAAAASRADIARWEQTAGRVTITRDDWGIAHVRGKTDADAVFGMLYAQAEDDFPRVEMNYVDALGRRAEAEGDSAVFLDLRMKLFVDPDTLRAQYRASPAWLRKLMDAFADGLNFYLHRHPDVKPRVITRFEPWMALAFTEGSIGGDIERVDVRELAAFYGAAPVLIAPARGDGELVEPGGSNGIAIAPRLTRAGHALLLINPHTSFYFRSELHISSDEGLDAYGAVTWGQFFIYQGFNRTAGWMHTSSGVDNIDEFLVNVMRREDRLSYRHGDRELPLKSRSIVVTYRTPQGMARRTFTVYETHHGPVVRKLGEQWVSVSLMRRPIPALTQSFTRTKVRDLAGFRKVMELHSNSSNNTLFADATGSIAYLHSNYIPRRDTTFDWTLPVDGGDTATAYRDVLSFDETPNAVNPASGWAYNVNNWPWSAAGPDSPRRGAFPRYVETGSEETPRGRHALRLLEGSKDWTLESLVAAAYDSFLPSFERLVPRLLEAFDRTPASDPLRQRVAEQVATLRGWDFRWGTESVPTTLAVHWGEALVRRFAADARAAKLSAQTYAAERARPAELLGALAAASDTLVTAFGSWSKPWGEINRFQRLDSEIKSRFDDAQPSIPVPFTSGNWGSLASYGARPQAGTRRWYGTSGNSFVAVVEFADSVRAVAVTAGGASGRKASPHFTDQAERYANGQLREVYFHRSQLKGHIEREYHPGE
jgi:acyl-homoserine-lactone acylase